MDRTQAVAILMGVDTICNVGGLVDDCAQSV